MKTLITILLSGWMLSSRAQEPLYEIKNRGLATNIATGTQTVVAGLIFTTTVEGYTKPVLGTITIKGHNKVIEINADGPYWIEISELVKSRKKITMYCSAKNYKTQKRVINFSNTNSYQVNFELVPKK
jgi:hypothetical protein